MALPPNAFQAPSGADADGRPAPANAGARVIGPILGTSVFEHRRRRGMGFVAAVCAVVDVALALTLRDGSAKEAAEEEKTN